MLNATLIIKAAEQNGFKVYRAYPYTPTWEILLIRDDSKVFINTVDFTNFEITWVDEGEVTLTATISAERIAELF